MKNRKFCPFTIVIDSREQRPFEFSGVHSNYTEIPTISGTLATGDYSILGMQHLLAIERKSLSDLYLSAGQYRERFAAAHRRMSELKFAAVVIEADWQTIRYRPPPISRMAPASVWATAMSWQVRYRIPWLAMPDRRLAAQATFDLLQMFFEQSRISRFRFPNSQGILRCSPLCLTPPTCRR